MKTLRQTCAAMILSLTLAVSVLAGHMDTTGAPSPAPSPTPNASTTSTTTNIILMIIGLIYR